MEIRDTFITFAGQVQKTKKDVKVKGFVRKGKFVRAFDRNQEVNVKNEKSDLAKKVAIGSLATLAGVLGVGLAGAAVVKLRYNSGLINAGKQINRGTFKDVMKVPKTATRYVAPKEIPDKKSMTFFVGGLDKAEEVAGEGLLVTVKATLRKQKIEKNHELIPLYHNYQLMKGEADSAGMIQSIRDVFETTATKAKNPDSLAMADEIYKWHKLNPTKSINIITHSAGGFQGRDIPQVLTSAGVNKDLIKVFSTGSPDYGMVDDIVKTKRIMHVDDVYSEEIPLPGKLGLPSLHRNTTFVRGALESPEFRRRVKEEAIKDAKKAGRDISDISSLEYRIGSHFSPGYYSGYSPASKRTQEELTDFMFKD